ncbi:hypothetical protein J4226_03715 [Candidatus Pacearchaeota archaeon]|nr:hypothetical protein [Candidatus Pacearchaeota archaeon]
MKNSFAKVDRRSVDFEVDVKDSTLIIFSNYLYSHEKFQTYPANRGSTPNDDYSELELELDKEWSYNFKGIFAKAMEYSGTLMFFELNKKIVDGKHLTIENLIIKYKMRTRH